MSSTRGAAVAEGAGRWQSGTMISAYVLIQTEVGMIPEVAAAVAGIKGVSSADGVTGPYDVIARAEATDLDALGKLVLRRIQDIPGVTRTLTCPIIGLTA